ncbi:hypothetical protein DSM21852_05270 [Methylocystis bryophila]|nr:hypothetical protein DSM21852_05270 [Methylocystis bryophila]
MGPEKATAAAGTLASMKTPPPNIPVVRQAMSSLPPRLAWAKKRKGSAAHATPSAIA